MASLIPSIATKAEPPSSQDSNWLAYPTGNSSQEQENTIPSDVPEQLPAPNPSPPPNRESSTSTSATEPQPLSETPSMGAQQPFSLLAAEPQTTLTAGLEESMPQTQQPVEPYPTLSPLTGPIVLKDIERVPDLPPLADDDEELDSSLETLVAKMRPRTQSQEIIPLPVKPVKIEVKTESVSGPLPRRSPTSAIIDLTESSPSPPPSHSKPKRKQTPASTSSSFSTAEPPSKRAKTESQARFPAAQKHSDHWLLDGNIIIQVHGTKFRLHRSFLVKHSAWFAELIEGGMINVPDIYRCEEDGMPMYILTLPNLTAKDFERLLDGFDNAIKYVHKDPSFPRVAGILRAATALSFDHFREWATQFLKDRWPASLEEFSGAEDIKHATESVVLARTCDVPEILKRAMYELVRKAEYGQPQTGSGSGNHVQLAPEDFRALIRARDKLTVMWMTTMGASSFSPPFATCASAVPPPAAAPGEGGEGAPVAPPPPPQQAGPPCTTLDQLLSGKAHHKLMRESGIADEYIYDPICGLEALVEADWAGEGYCKGCVELRRGIWEGTRERLWRDLGEWFGLVGE
ncbi:hypothetical protein FB45DRAFT_901053 [Roridomyces roridus]|uniref:BTB domain-containing protein n=1 Tax=Roridomyces roridus TaxID=1738132 RepID=A0AAD7C8J7_9AGAR|nr:hypothetical protein FB45DRAFT_901053 [Roridomyces roridus]